MKVFKIITATTLITILCACTILESSRWPSGDNKILLTFDDGPNGQVSKDLLEVLNKHHVKATFFYVGRNIEKHPDIVKQADKDGHELAIHSYDRSFPPFFSFQDLKGDIDKTIVAINNATGKNIHRKLYRPPRGLNTPAVRKLIKDTPYEIGYLNFYLLSINEPKAGPADANRLLEKYKKEILKRKGAAIVFHESRFKKSPEVDNTIDKSWLPQAVDDLIIWGKANGFEFVLYR